MNPTPSYGGEGFNTMKNKTTKKIEAYDFANESFEEA